MIILIVIMALSCSLLYFMHKEKRERTEKEKIFNTWLDAQSESDIKTHTLENLKAISKIQYLAEDMTVQNISLYNINNNDSCRLTSKLANKYKLIYYFSNKGCPGCHEPIILKLDEIGKKIGYDKIIILANFETKRHLNTYWLNKPSLLLIHRISNDLGLFNILDDSHYAYAFLLNSDLSPVNL